MINVLYFFFVIFNTYFASERLNNLKMFKLKQTNYEIIEIIQIVFSFKLKKWLKLIKSTVSHLKFMKLPDLFNLEVGKLVHAHFQNKLPNNFSNLFFSY